MGKGYLPDCFAGRDIKFRIPYVMDGELTVTSGNSSGNQFPAATFLHNVDKPFEIHRVIVRVTGLDGNGNVLRAQDTIYPQIVRLTIEDSSKNERLTKSATLASLLSHNTSVSRDTWEWECPYTLVRSEGFEITVDTLAFPTGTSQLRIEVAFQGYLLVIEAPSENR